MDTAYAFHIRVTWSLLEERSRGGSTSGQEQSGNGAGLARVPTQLVWETRTPAGKGGQATEGSATDDSARELHCCSALMGSGKFRSCKGL